MSKKYIRYFRKYADAGISLVELIIAASLTAVVVSIAGYGVVWMTQGNVKGSLESEMQYNLNRAVELVTEEIRLGNNVLAVPSNYISTLASGVQTAINAKGTNITPVLSIKFPTSVASAGSEVIYFTIPRANIATGEPERAWLKGDVVLYRYGPGLNADGSYTSSPIVTPIVDMLSNVSAPSCPTTNPSLTRGGNVAGFYVCWDGALTKRKIEIYAATRLSEDRRDLDSNNPRLDYKIDTVAVTRSSN